MNSIMDFWKSRWKLKLWWKAWSLWYCGSGSGSGEFQVRLEAAGGGVRSYRESSSGKEGRVCPW